MTALMSSTSTNCATHSKISAHHLREPPSFAFAALNLSSKRPKAPLLTLYFNVKLMYHKNYGTQAVASGFRRAVLRAEGNHDARRWGARGFAYDNLERLQPPR